MKEDKLKPFTDFYRKIVFADKVFDVNFQEIARVLFNEVDRLNSIIKEARELLNQEWYSVLRKGTIRKVREILDEEGE